jgi:hypothetical protein
MSNIKADNFTWKTGEATGQSRTTVTGSQVVYGVSKAWCNYYCVTSVTNRRSFNVSSLTRNGSGDVTVAFTNSLPDSYWCLTASCDMGSSGASYNNKGPGPRDVSTNTASSTRLLSSNAGGYDMASNMISIFS